MKNKPAGYWKSDEENNSNPEEGPNFPVFVEDLQVIADLSDLEKQLEKKTTALEIIRDIAHQKSAIWKVANEALGADFKLPQTCSDAQRTVNRRLIEENEFIETHLAEANRKIEIMESKASQFESMILATVKARDEAKKYYDDAYANAYEDCLRQNKVKDLQTQHATLVEASRELVFAAEEMRSQLKKSNMESFPPIAEVYPLLRRAIANFNAKVGKL